MVFVAAFIAVTKKGKNRCNPHLMARLMARPFMGLLAITYQNLSLCQSKHHQRYVCTRLDLPFNTVERAFTDRNDVKMWMIELQSGRRNLNDAWRYKLAMTHKEILLEIGKKKISVAVTAANIASANSDVSTLSIMDKVENAPTYQQTDFCEPVPIVEPTPEKHNTQQVIAKKLNWSTGKVAMADKVFNDWCCASEAQSPVNKTTRNHLNRVQQSNNDCIH